MSMSARPRSARLSSTGEVVAILVASAVAWTALIGALLVLFFGSLVPTLQYGGRSAIPSDFPVYPGAHLESAISTTTNRCSTVDATWSTSDGASQVVDFYTSRLPEAGYTIGAPTPGRGGADLGFAKPAASTNGSVYITSRGGRTVIELTLFKGSGGGHCAAL